MKRTRVLALALAAGAFLTIGTVTIPALASDTPLAAFASALATVKGDVTPFQNQAGVVLPEYANQTTLWVYRGRILFVSTAALHCDQTLTVCRADTPPSMWSDAVKALDPLATRTAQRPGGIDALNYDDRGGAGEAKPFVIDMYRRALRSAMAKAGL